jgi:hypothetical protein
MIEENTHPLVGVAIFLLVWFFYLHITSQWKTSEDLEIYETEYINPTHLQEVCHVRQPVLFQLRPEAHLLLQRMQIPIMQKYYQNTVCIRDTSDIPSSGLEMPFQTALTLTEKDPHSKYFSEQNAQFIEESSLGNLFSAMNDYIRPPLCIHQTNDIMFGSKGAATPLRYHTKSMQYLIVTCGKIHVKMAPWKSRKYLYPTKDYNWYEFRSNMDVWKSCSPHVQCLEFDVYPGMMLFIPPYWFYSIQYTSDTTTTVASLAYTTAINAFANSYDLLVYYAQLQGFGNNVKPIIHDEITQPPIILSQSPEQPPKKNEEIVTNVEVYKP